jgi:hypothetical protein
LWKLLRTCFSPKRFCGSGRRVGANITLEMFEDVQAYKATLERSLAGCQQAKKLEALFDGERDMEAKLLEIVRAVLLDLHEALSWNYATTAVRGPSPVSHAGPSLLAAGLFCTEPDVRGVLRRWRRSGSSSSRVQAPFLDKDGILLAWAL